MIDTRNPRRNSEVLAIKAVTPSNWLFWDTWGVGMVEIVLHSAPKK